MKIQLAMIAGALALFACKPVNNWETLTVEGPTCGNGSPVSAAIDRAALNTPNPSDKLVIFLQGGGACWDAATCGAGAATSISEDLTDEAVLQQAIASSEIGILSREDEQNPFRNDSLAYVPYCTGDIHSGGNNAPSPFTGIVHSGGNNLVSFIGDSEEGLISTFPDVKEVFLIGASAGGFGSILMHQTVQEAFGDVPVHLLSDGGVPLGQIANDAWENNPANPTYDLSGPAYDEYFLGFQQQTGLPDQVIPAFRTSGKSLADFQQQLIFTWGSTPFLATDDNGIPLLDLESIFIDNVNENPDVRFGVITSMDDKTIQRFTDTGLYGNYSSLILPQFGVTGTVFTQNDWLTVVNDFESIVTGDGSKNTQAFIKDDSTHVYTLSDLKVKADNKQLKNWLKQFRKGNPSWKTASDTVQ